MRARTDTYDFEKLRRIFRYNKKLGTLRWKKRIAASCRDRTFNTIRAGKLAGYLHKKTGYMRVRTDGVSLMFHRVCFILGSGKNLLPDDFVDHRKQDQLNNKYSNLRKATSAQNAWNRKSHKDRIYDLPKNVVMRGAKFHAHFYVKGLLIDVGNFATVEEAEAALIPARIKHHGQFARHQ